MSTSIQKQCLACLVSLSVSVCPFDCLPACFSLTLSSYEIFKWRQLESFNKGSYRTHEKKKGTTLTDVCLTVVSSVAWLADTCVTHTITTVHTCSSILTGIISTQIQVDFTPVKQTSIFEQIHFLHKRMSVAVSAEGQRLGYVADMH